MTWLWIFFLQAKSLLTAGSQISRCIVFSEAFLKTDFSSRTVSWKLDNKNCLRYLSGIFWHIFPQFFFFPLYFWPDWYSQVVMIMYTNSHSHLLCWCNRNCTLLCDARDFNASSTMISWSFCDGAWCLQGRWSTTESLIKTIKTRLLLGE